MKRRTRTFSRRALFAMSTWTGLAGVLAAQQGVGQFDPPPNPTAPRKPAAAKIAPSPNGKPGFQYVAKQESTSQPSDVSVPRDVDLSSLREPEQVAQRDSIANVTPSTTPAANTETAAITADSLGAAPVAKSADLTEQLASASNIETVRVERRSPVSFDPRIRGYRGGQVYSQADGAFWRPVRDDLDTVLSKFAPNTIAAVRVVNGPYSVQYGPGFSFIDVLTFDTGRSECGYEGENIFGVSYRMNGDQWYAYDLYEGSGEDYGYRFGYGNRTGIDYEAGGENGPRIPGSYHAQDFTFQYGFDINPSQRVEFRYLHLDQTESEYFDRIFDINALVTDSFNLKLIDESPEGPWSKFVVESWYNQTPYHGDTLSPGKSQVIGRINRALEDQFAQVGTPVTSANFKGFTFGEIQSLGGRGAMTFGEEECGTLTVGADIRYLQQRIGERFFTIGGNAADNTILATNLIDDFSTNLPASTMIDPGAFLEVTMPLTTYWKATAGARVDFIHTDADETEVRTDGTLQRFPNADDLSRNDTTYAAFLNTELQIDDVWTAEAGVGHAQRPPTLTERYSDGVFLGVFQNGYSRVLGNPNLKPERLWQVDAGMRADWEDSRGGLRAFHAWIYDYLTFEVLTATGPDGAIIVRGASSQLATLTGFELFGEQDLTRQFTLFGNVAYIDGRDRQIDAPLTGVYPLEGRAGFRWHAVAEEQERPRWSLEFFGRIVAAQDRLAGLRGPSAFGFTPSDIVAVESETPGFTVFNLRGHWDASQAVRFTAGIENVFDRKYLEHLDLRLPVQTSILNNAVQFDKSELLAPGFTPYLGVEWRR